jgi:type I site-specific restriction endonuclease
MDIKLEKIDEAYLRVISDDRGILMELSEFFTFFVPGYRFMPAFKNKMWDGKLRLFDMRTNKIYQGLQKYIEKFCEERGYSLEIPHQQPFDNNIDWIDYLPLGKGNAIKARDYQKDAIKYALTNRNGILLSPTASGKSLIIYLLIRYFLEYNKTQKILLIVPTTSLVKQMYGDFAE